MGWTYPRYSHQAQIVLEFVENEEKFFADNLEHQYQVIGTS